MSPSNPNPPNARASAQYGADRRNYHVLAVKTPTNGHPKDCLSQNARARRASTEKKKKTNVVATTGFLRLAWAKRARSSLSHDVHAQISEYILLFVWRWTQSAARAQQQQPQHIADGISYRMARQFQQLLRGLSTEQRPRQARSETPKN